MRNRPLVYLVGNAFYAAGVIVLLVVEPSHVAAGLFWCALGAVVFNRYIARVTRPDPRRIARMERQAGLPPSDLSYLDRGKRRR